MEDILRDSFGLVKCPDKNRFQATFFISRLVAKMPLALTPEPKLQHLAWIGDVAQNGSYLAAPPLPRSHLYNRRPHSILQCHAIPY